ncbi:MAG: helix-turn-helix transcriptional regulator [Mobilitalea sp.]
MNHLETSDWLVLNNLIYKIYSTNDLSEMRKTLLEQLKMVIDFDSADFFLGKKNGTKGLEGLVSYNCDTDTSAQYDELDYSRGIMYTGKSMVYRESDIISEDKRKQTEYYQKVYRPNNWHYSLQMVIAKEKKFLGVITFYRTIGKDDFNYDDIFLLDMLKDHIALRLYQTTINEAFEADKLTVHQTVEKHQLTKREETIIRLLINGLDNDVICEELSISPNTLKKHILNIYRKLGINNRIQMFKMIKEKEK